MAATRPTAIIISLAPQGPSTHGFSAARKRWCIMPLRRGERAWCTRSWTGIGRPCGCRTATPPNKGMPTASRPAWRTSPACVAYALDAGDDTLALRLNLWLDGAFALARTITTSAPSTVTTKRRKLERSLGDILAAPATCDLARDI